MCWCLSRSIPKMNFVFCLDVKEETTTTTIQKQQNLNCFHICSTLQFERQLGMVGVVLEKGTVSPSCICFLCKVQRRGLVEKRERGGVTENRREERDTETETETERQRERESWVDLV